LETVSTRQPRPTTPADLHRLAAVAHTRGLRLTQDGNGRWFCSSASGSAPHLLTGYSCDCLGFQSHQHYSHYALLLAALGWLPALKDAPAAFPMGNTPAPDACLWCAGSGRIANDLDAPHLRPLLGRVCDAGGNLTTANDAAGVARGTALACAMRPPRPDLAELHIDTREAFQMLPLPGSMATTQVISAAVFARECDALAMTD
jgi:hypothetical protein